MRKSLFLGIIFSLVLVFLTATFALALELTPPTNATSIEALIEGITNFVFNLAIIIAPIMFIIAGFFFITSSGEPERVKKARNIFVYTLIGLVIVLIATGLYALIAEILGAEGEPPEEPPEEDEEGALKLDFLSFHYIYNENYRQQVAVSG